MTEQEWFIQAMKSEFGDLVDLRICLNGNGGFMAWDAQVAFWAWQAAQQKEGYVLVPVESVQEVLRWLTDNSGAFEYASGHAFLECIKHRDILQQAIETAQEAE